MSLFWWGKSGSFGFLPAKSSTIACLLLWLWKLRDHKYHAVHPSFHFKLRRGIYCTHFRSCSWAILGNCCVSSSANGVCPVAGYSTVSQLLAGYKCPKTTCVTLMESVYAPCTIQDFLYGVTASTARQLLSLISASSVFRYWWAWRIASFIWAISHFNTSIFELCPYLWGV